MDELVEEYLCLVESSCLSREGALSLMLIHEVRLLREELAKGREDKPDTRELWRLVEGAKPAHDHRPLTKRLKRDMEAIMAFSQPCNYCRGTGHPASMCPEMERDLRKHREDGPQ